LIGDLGSKKLTKKEFEEDRFMLTKQNTIMDSTTMMVGGQIDDSRNMSIDAKDFKFGG
jgi:hypothetical protein